MREGFEGGIMSGAFANENRNITKDDWLREVFPEWGTMLNQQIENAEHSWEYGTPRDDK